MNLFEKKMELSRMLQSEDGMSSNELIEGINECIKLAFKESKNKLVNAHEHSLPEILTELKFGKPKNTQILINKWIKEYSGDSGWCGELVKCDLCGAEWAAVYNENCDKLQCPSCHKLVLFKVIT